MDTYISDLKKLEKDDLQHQAFMSGQNTIVRAGPGSGKTKIITMKIADLLINSIKEPRGLACITFTKDAAKEFSTRVNRLGVKPRKNVYLGTLHGFCITQVILPFSVTATKHIPSEILTDRKLDSLFKEVKNKLIDVYNVEQLPEDRGKLDEYRNSSFEGVSTVKGERNNVWDHFVSLYEDELIKLNVTDYTLLVKQVIEVIERSSLVKNILEAKFKWLLIDEYQDFNKLFHELILALKKYTNIKLFIVGDPNQSVYSFMGGSHKYFEEFYEDESFRVINLENNYRSTQDIVNAAAQFLDIDDVEYKAKGLVDVLTKLQFITCDVGWKDQVKYIVETIIPACDEGGIPREEICILVNNNYKSKNVQTLLLEYNIKGRINKDDLFNNDFIQFFISIMKFEITKDVSFKSLITTWQKIKFQKNNNMSDSSINAERLLLYKAIEDSRSLMHDVNAWVLKIMEILQLDVVLQSYIGMDNHIQIERIKDYFYEEDIMAVAIKIEKIFPDDEIIISTRHSSKGLEFDVVIILEMDEDNFPNSNEEDDFSLFVEEKRLFFVCVTRARRELYLLTSSNRWSMEDGRWKKISQRPSIFFNDFLTICGELGINYEVERA